MDILTITCHNVYNHGALLQAWALVSFLRKKGAKAAIIDYQPDYLRGHYDLSVRNSRYDYPVIKQLYLLAKYPGWRKSLKRKYAFDAFSDKYLRPFLYKRTYFNYEDLKLHPPKADVYIAGSDQIWNTRFKNGRDSAFYLNFGAKNTRRLSYAASFATEQLYEGTSEFVKNELGKFEAISVREKSGLEILRNLGFVGVQVADPVFLLDASEWISQIECPFLKLPGKPYILVYDTNESKELSIVVERIRRLTKMEVYTLSDISLVRANSKFKNVGPDGFLHLIANASIVVSNSFHASAFSMIFERNFFVVERPDGLNRRMRDLLDIFQLSGRLINSTTPNDILTSDIEYEKVLHSLNVHIKESKLWLSQVL